MQNASISQCLLKSKNISKHYGIILRAINNGSKSSENGIPDEIEIEGDSFKNSQTVLLDFSLTVKAAPNECVIRTSQP